MAEKIILLGSTGSIGTQTLEVVRQHRDRLSVSALIANRSVEAVEAQAREFCVPCCAMFQEEAAKELRSRLKDTKTKVLSGMEGILEIMEQSDADTVLSAVVGMIGILPTIRAIECGKDIALANKETLVVAGELITELAVKHRAPILPVDSEHSAIFQSLVGEDGNAIDKILLTASGGPFRTTPIEELANVTAARALKHPNWEMGAKITIDSATMMNKGFEMIEAKWLFGVEPERIEVLVHPESIVHSAVQLADGGVKAQLGVPDMRLPIQYALSFPRRLSLSGERLDLAALGRLTFERPDFDKFDCLRIAYEAIAAGGNLPCVVNAANEVANAAFRRGAVGFLDIPRLIRRAMADATRCQRASLSDYLASDAEVRRLVAGYLN